MVHNKRLLLTSVMATLDKNETRSIIPNEIPAMEDTGNLKIKKIKRIKEYGTKNTINGILNELETNNYLERKKIYCNGKISDWEYSIYENYSGRFMFGEKCLGIVVRQGNSYMEMLMKLTQYLDDNSIEDAGLQMEGVSVDELGLDTVVYFPLIVE